MKLKTNKACDLSSISVFPSHQCNSRRLGAATSGPQASQHRSLASQQSISQGLSSQHGMFSQLSQTSLDEALTNDQRFNSQDRENPAKKTSCLPPISHTHEESQMPVSRTSTCLIRNWNSAPFQDHRGKLSLWKSSKYVTEKGFPVLEKHGDSSPLYFSQGQINEELEHRIGMMETSLNKIGMILDSVQSDVMQVNKRIKEVSLEMEGMQHKLIVLDSSLQLMKKGQEDIKLGINGSLKSLSEQLNNDAYQNKLQQIFLLLSALPKQIEASLLKLHRELQTTFTEETQGIVCSLMTSAQKSPSIIKISPQVTGNHAAPRRKKVHPKNPAMRVRGQATVAPKVDEGFWNSVKLEKPIQIKKATFTRKKLHKEQKPARVSSVRKSLRQERQCTVNIESDDDINGGLSCLIEEKETGVRNHMTDQVNEETEQMLRKARSKRKYCNPIIIN